MHKIGLYVHVPFCVSKCPYCDFYSLPNLSDELLDRYTQALMAAMDHWAATTDVVADTLYFGGGTPSLLGGERLGRLIRHADARFQLFEGGTPEITLEANPADDLRETFCRFADAGGNRLSLGMQSAHAEELQSLGRRHTPAQVERAIRDAHDVGLANLSLDLMLGIPGQTVNSAVASVHRAVAWGARHLSAYMLKLEPQTPFGQQPPLLPDDDDTADIYMAVMDTLDRCGFEQYEISNAALPGYASRHNRKYWVGDAYLGFGPAASSYFDGRRFSYPRDLAHFLNNGGVLPEQDEAIPSGSPEEYAMLRLRLAEGLADSDYLSRFGTPIPAEWYERADALPDNLVSVTDESIRLTREGFLVSNSLICHILGV